MGEGWCCWGGTDWVVMWRFRRSYEGRIADVDSFRNCRLFNTGSPWNIPAGQGGANLDKLIAHYERKNFEEEEKKVRTLREGKKEPDPDSIVRRGTY